MTTNPILICMRLANMRRVHPNQITRECSVCHHAVGIYPSGQRVLASVDIDIVCEICRPQVDIAILAPGAEAERSESEDRQ